MKKNGASAEHDVSDRAALFVKDFTSLIADVDRLMVHLGRSNGISSNGKPNGHAGDLTLNGTISTLRNHANSFAKSLRSTVVAAKEDPVAMYQLALELGRAHSLSAIGEIVGRYCTKTFHALAGMMFVERDGDLQMVSEWGSRQIPKRFLADEVFKKGSATRAFRTGEPVFWRSLRTSPPKSSARSRELQKIRRSVTFLPIAVPDERPVGVLALILPEPGATLACGELVRLVDMIAGCVVRARVHDDAILARNRAQEAIHNQDDFFSTLSHELKGPMMPILGWAVALSSRTLPDDKQNIALDVIVRNVRALNYMIEDLFDAARISSGKLRLQLHQIRIQDVAREALAAIQQTLEDKKLRISTDISEGIPPFMADPRRLHQVLINLLNNAVKFTPEGGSIALQVRKRGDNVECIVSDTGKGIERKFLPFVFDKFRQGNRSTKVRAAGIGLGLAIAREIVELHGGSIAALSDGNDKGAKFIARLPMRKRRWRKWRRRPANQSRQSLQ